MTDDARFDFDQPLTPQFKPTLS